MDIVEQLKWRYAVKKFDTDKMLPQEKVERLKEAFNLTATSFGLQPVTLVVIQNKQLQQKLVAHSFGQFQVAQASHVLVFCIHYKVDSKYISRYFEQIREIRGTSDKILHPFREALIDDFSKKDIDEIKTWSTNQAYLAMGNLLTICAAEKIDSCPMEGFESEAYNRVLQLDGKGLTSVLVMPIGIRAEDDMFSGFKKVRKSRNESVIDIL